MAKNKLNECCKKKQKTGRVYKFLLNNREKETIIRNFFVTLDRIMY